MTSLHGFGLGIVSENAQGAVLDTFYPQPVAHVSDALSSIYLACRVDWMLQSSRSCQKHWRQRATAPGLVSRGNWSPQRAK